MCTSMHISRLRSLFISRHVEQAVKLLNLGQRRKLHKIVFRSSTSVFNRMAQSPALERRKQFASQGSTILNDICTGGIAEDGGVDAIDLYDDELDAEGLSISTESDEERLKNLVKEIFSYRDSPVSNWIVEVSESLFYVFCMEIFFSNFIY